MNGTDEPFHRFRGARRSGCGAGTEAYLEHYHRERSHQVLGNRYLESNGEPRDATTPVECRERLGGLLNDYERAA